MADHLLKEPSKTSFVKEGSAVCAKALPKLFDRNRMKPQREVCKNTPDAKQAETQLDDSQVFSYTRQPIPISQGIK
jgi:hypothetical protein